MSERPTNPPQRPTDVELEILRVLWDLGPSTVRAVHRALATRKETGYSTTLKMMQVMRDKGLLVRDDSVRPQVYRTAATRERTEGQLVDDLVRRAFGGSASRLVLRALAAKRVSREELADIQKLIDHAKREAK
jgi:predicted transcriptional regulator